MSARHVFATMGTMVSIHADVAVEADVLRAVDEVFEVADRRFSLYRPDSELSRIAHGRLALTDASAELRGAYEQAIHWRMLTRGAFTPHRPDGVIDLSGIVKAIAIRDAGVVLETAGVLADIGCGGDVLLRRSRIAQRVGIADPADRARMLTSVELVGSRRAVATSGVSERGEHIWGPRTDFDQVTVVADDIVTADVVATAILAGGRETCDETTATIDVEVLAVRRDGGILGTPGIVGSPERRAAGHVPEAGADRNTDTASRIA